MKQYLTFNSGGECFALGILSIKEIIEIGRITTVPLMPTFVRGVINLRGAVVPVIDLSARLYGETLQTNKRSCIVIVELMYNDDVCELGVVVDSVNEVIELADTDLTDTPAFGVNVRADFIKEMARIDSKIVMILALEKILSIDELSQLVSESEMQTDRGD